MNLDNMPYFIYSIDFLNTYCLRSHQHTNKNKSCLILFSILIQYSHVVASPYKTAYLPKCKHSQNEVLHGSE